MAVGSLGASLTSVVHDVPFEGVAPDPGDGTIPVVRSEGVAVSARLSPTVVYLAREFDRGVGVVGAATTAGPRQTGTSLCCGSAVRSTWPPARYCTPS